MLRKIALVAIAVLAFPTAALACADHQQAAAEKASAATVAKAKKVLKVKKATTPTKSAPAKG